MHNILHRIFVARLGLVALLTLGMSTAPAVAGERGAAKYFDSISQNPPLLRNFLYGFPKGADLHNHIDGAVYAENYLRWAAADGKCVDLVIKSIVPPPCDAKQNRPSAKSIEDNGDLVNQLIDAFSTRNYQRREVSGHNQFFSTFWRFYEAGFGHEGEMIAEAAVRAERQQILYLELMQSYGMHAARQLAAKGDLFSGKEDVNELIEHPDVNRIVRETIEFTDGVEQQWKSTLGCDKNPNAEGCRVKVRYLAQVIRVFPREQVFAQTLLAFKLIAQDPRYVGLNFVAPEDHPVTLRDYKWQMETIGQLATYFPMTEKGISLHAGELALGLVPPEDLRSHIREAIELAGARRIGHGVAIMYEAQARELLRKMAAEQIMVEINLTSNADILGIEGDEHPFAVYREYGVPLALSTDDEGVSRIDLTHEYQRAVQTYGLSYRDLKGLSRNSLAYSFLPGDSLFSAIDKGQRVKACAKDKPEAQSVSAACQSFLDNSEKAQLQWRLEQQFLAFEHLYR